MKSTSVKNDKGWGCGLRPKGVEKGEIFCGSSVSRELLFDSQGGMMIPEIESGCQGNTLLCIRTSSEDQRRTFGMMKRGNL